MWVPFINFLILIGLVCYVVYDARRTLHSRKNTKDLDVLISSLNDTCSKMLKNAEIIEDISQTIERNGIEKLSAIKLHDIAQDQMNMMKDFLRVNNDLVNAIYLDLGFIKRRMVMDKINEQEK